MMAQRLASVSRAVRQVLLEPLREALAHVNVSAELLPLVSDDAACAIALCDGRGSVPAWIGFFDALITLLFAAHWCVGSLRMRDCHCGCVHLCGVVWCVCKCVCVRVSV